MISFAETNCSHLGNYYVLCSSNNFTITHNKMVRAFFASLFFLFRLKEISSSSQPWKNRTRVGLWILFLEKDIIIDGFEYNKMVIIRYVSNWMNERVRFPGTLHVIQVDLNSPEWTCWQNQIAYCTFVECGVSRHLNRIPRNFGNEYPWQRKMNYKTLSRSTMAAIENLITILTLLKNVH